MLDKNKSLFPSSATIVDLIQPWTEIEIEIYFSSSMIIQYCCMDDAMLYYYCCCLGDLSKFIHNQCRFEVRKT